MKIQVPFWMGRSDISLELLQKKNLMINLDGLTAQMGMKLRIANTKKFKTTS